MKPLKFGQYNHSTRRAIAWMQIIVLICMLVDGSLRRLAADLVPSALSFTVKSVGTPSTSDRDAFRFVIDRDNASRTNAGLAAWPTATAADYRTSYELFCAAMIQGLHTNYIVQASQVERVLEKIPKETQLEINRAVLDLLNNGTTPDAILQRLK